jgi:hypothetical protein
MVLILAMSALTTANAAIVTVPVTNPDPAGSGGLVEAIDVVNAGNPGDIHIIEIALPPFEWTIELEAPLPAIAQRAVILRGTRDREAGRYIIKGNEMGTIFDMSGSGALLYSIENLILRESGEACAIMVANTVNVINSAFVDCLPDTGNLSALNINGTATISESEFNSNYLNCPAAPCYGGAVNAQGGRLTIESSFFGNNRAFSTAGVDAFGGAVHTARGIEVSDSMFEFNLAGEPDVSDGIGGAIHVNGNALIYRSAFISNAAYSDSGGGASGGAIAHRPDATINQSLLRAWNVYFRSNFVAPWGPGGAIRVFDDGGNSSRLDVRNSTFSFNKSYSAGHDLYLAALTEETIYHSIFDSPDGNAPCFKPGINQPLEGGWNLVGLNPCAVSGRTQVADFGFGDTQTVGRVRFRELLPGSPAIDAGNPAASDFSDPSTCRPTDIAGTDRPWAGTSGSAAVCDIGATEFIPDTLFSDAFEQ